MTADSQALAAARLLLAQQSRFERFCQDHDVDAADVAHDPGLLDLTPILDATGMQFVPEPEDWAVANKHHGRPPSSAEIIDAEIVEAEKQRPAIPRRHCRGCGTSERRCESSRLWASRACCADCDHDDRDAS